MSRKNKIVKWADVCDWNYFWSTWDKTASTGFSSECFVFRINTSIQLRSSLITINSVPFRCEKTKRNLFHFQISIRISFELTNWSNLSIIFDLFGVLCVQTIGDYHKLCSRVEKEARKRKKENFFHPAISTPPEFIFLINLIREERQKKQPR